LGANCFLPLQNTEGLEVDKELIQAIERMIRDGGVFDKLIIDYAKAEMRNLFLTNTFINLNPFSM
jgi:hypothetical protein